MTFPVVHLELHTDDLTSARELYGELCGWRCAAPRGPYVGLDMGRRLGGGIVECDAPRPLWLPYVEVADITTATHRALTLGADLLLDPREGPAGWRSVVTTPAGGELAFWQQKR
jgi:predicted enzyme related to lactoylglutathione lyase